MCRILGELENSTSTEKKKRKEREEKKILLKRSLLGSFETFYKMVLNKQLRR